MEVLSNFNTGLDRKYITDSSFVVKNYFMYIFSFQNIILYLTFVALLFLFFFLQHKAFNDIISISISVVYGTIFFIWIFFHSTFIYQYIKNHSIYYDQKNKYVLEKMDEKYDKVLIISLIVLFVNGILSLASVFYLFFLDSIDNLLYTVGYIFINLCLLMIQWMIIKKALIDFEMDFLVFDMATGEILYVEQGAFFNKKIRTARFDLTVGVNTDSEGILRSLLEYGQLRVAKPSGERDIVMKYVKNVSHIERIIKLSMEKYKEKI